MSRSEAKDALAWSIIYGGSTAAAIALGAALGAAHLLTGGRYRIWQILVVRYKPGMQARAWSEYESTGDILKAIETFFS